MAEWILQFDDTPSTSSARPFVPVSKVELDDLVASRIPANTQAKVDWAMNVFLEWLRCWRVRLDGELKVFKEPEEMTASDLDHCLQYFFAEIRKKDGKRFPPATMKDIVSCIQHHFRNRHKRTWSIFKDHDFTESRKVLDASMKVSAQEGNVIPKKRAAAIPMSYELDLWEKGTFGWSNPKQLLSTLVYHFGLHFALRACQEHRDLLFGDDSQISLDKDPYTGAQRLKYVERTSKNKKFGINQCRLEPKVTYAYEHEDKRKCVIELYKKYISHRPESHGQPGNTAFYLTPIPNPKGPVWYKNMPVGVNTISSTLKQIMASVDDGNFYSNTSLRRTAKTRLTDSGFDRDVVIKKTGHLSHADICYIDTSRNEKAMSLALYGDKEENIVSEKQPVSNGTSRCGTEVCEQDGIAFSDASLTIQVTNFNEQKSVSTYCIRLYTNLSFMYFQESVSSTSLTCRELDQTANLAVPKTIQEEPQVNFNVHKSFLTYYY
jgi:hypothetical protein